MQHKKKKNFEKWKIYQCCRNKYDNWNVEHDIITLDANNVSEAEIWECSKSQYDITDAVTITKIIVF